MISTNLLTDLGSTTPPLVKTKESEASIEQLSRETGSPAMAKEPLARAAGLSQKDGAQLVEQLNQALESLGNQQNSFIQFQMDDQSGKMVFYLKDAQTQETLRQIPDALLLKISANIKQYLEQVQSDLRQPSGLAKLPAGLITDATA